MRNCEIAKFRLAQEIVSTVDKRGLHSSSISQSRNSAILQFS